MSKTLQKQRAKEAEDFIRSGKKLDQVIEEDVEVSTISPQLSQDGKRVSFKTGVEKIKQKSVYTQGVTSTVICEKHFFIPEDPKRYIFKCRNEDCKYHFQARVPTHKYNPETGELINRMTGRVIK